MRITSNVVRASQNLIFLVSGCGAVGSLREKTIDYRFYDAKSLKQEVGEASVPSDERRLCDGVFSPTGRAESFAKSSCSHNVLI